MINCHFQLFDWQRFERRWPHVRRWEHPSGSDLESTYWAHTSVPTTGRRASNRMPSGCRQVTWRAAVRSYDVTAPTCSSVRPPTTCRPVTPAAAHCLDWWWTATAWRWRGTMRGHARWRGSRDLNAARRHHSLPDSRTACLEHDHSAVHARAPRISYMSALISSNRSTRAKLSRLLRKLISFIILLLKSGPACRIFTQKQTGTLSQQISVKKIF